MVAMPFSGGQDSFMNLLLQIRKDFSPIHLFYFRMKTGTSKTEEAHIKRLVPLLLDSVNFKDARLHFVDAFDLRGVAQEPNPFVPFRNYYFAQYLMGLGFKKLLFSFSADDALFYDTSDSFMEELKRMGRDNMREDIDVYTLTRTMCRIDYVRFLLDQYGDNSPVMNLYKKDTHSCSDPLPCRSCMSCLLREIGDMWLSSASPDVGRKAAQKRQENFKKHWQGHTTLRDLYRRVLVNGFVDPVARDQYWRFLEGFASGDLLKGIAF